MPRYARYRPKSTKDLEPRTKKFRVQGYKGWHDPFPNVHGTLPEKMVYAALSFRNIPFLFLNDYQFEISEIEFIKEYQADFIIPSLRIIIEVQGAYWHSKPESIESDSFKFAVYEMLGWRAVAWWDYEIINNVNLLFAKDPQLSQYSVVKNTTSELPVISRKKQDTSKGIRTLNYKRGQRLSYKKKPVKVKTKKSKIYGSSISNG